MDLMVVSSHFGEDISWLERMECRHLVVSKNKELALSKNLVVVPNRGLEFGSYVWYILSHWDRLPEKVAFVHGHRFSYHQQYDMIESLRMMRDFEIASLNGEFSVALHRLENHVWFGRSFPEMWSFLGLDRICSAPAFVAIPPCTQVVISSHLLKSLGRGFWERIFGCLMTHDAHRHLALVMEIAWPLIFGMKVPVADEFLSFFEDRNLTALIAHPRTAWCSSMTNTVSFEPQKYKKDWVSRCSEIFF